MIRPSFDIEICHAQGQQLLPGVAADTDGGVVDVEQAPATGLDQPEGVLRGARQVDVALSRFLQGGIERLAFGDVAADRSQAHNLASGIADTEEVVEQPDRLAGLEVAHGNLYVALALP